MLSRYVTWESRKQGSDTVKSVLRKSPSGCWTMKEGAVAAGDIDESELKRQTWREGMPFRREALGCCWLNGTLMKREALAWRQWCAFDGDVEGWARMLLLIQVIQWWEDDCGLWYQKNLSEGSWALGLTKRSERELHAEGKWEHRQTGGLSYRSRVHVGRIGSGRQAETTWRPCLTLFSAWFHLPVLQQPQGDNCADSYEHLNGGRPPGRVHWPLSEGY